MPKGYRKYSPEFREEVAKMVVDTSRSIAEVGREYGINETTIGNWVRAYREKRVFEVNRDGVTARCL